MHGQILIWQMPIHALELNDSDICDVSTKIRYNKGKMLLHITGQLADWCFENIKNRKSWDTVVLTAVVLTLASFSTVGTWKIFLWKTVPVFRSGQSSLGLNSLHPLLKFTSTANMCRCREGGDGISDRHRGCAALSLVVIAMVIAMVIEPLRAQNFPLPTSLAWLWLDTEPEEAISVELMHKREVECGRESEREREREREQERVGVIERGREAEVVFYSQPSSHFQTAVQDAFISFPKSPRTPTSPYSPIPREPPPLLIPQFPENPHLSLFPNSPKPPLIPKFP